MLVICSDDSGHGQPGRDETGEERPVRYHQVAVPWLPVRPKEEHSQQDDGHGRDDGAERGPQHGACRARRETGLAADHEQDGPCHEHSRKLQAVQPAVDRQPPHP